MSESSDVAPAPVVSTRAAEVAPARPALVGPILGLLVVAAAISGLADDSGMIDHPPWLVPVVALGLGAMAAAIATVVHTWSRAVGDHAGQDSPQD